MPFVKFTAYGAASRTDVTIRTNDLLFISKSALRQFNENAKFAIINIDESNSLIGLEFVEVQPEDSNYRKMTEENAGVSLNIAPVLRFLGIKKLSKKETMPYEKREGMLVFSVKKLTDKKTADD